MIVSHSIYVSSSIIIHETVRMHVSFMFVFVVAGPNSVAVLRLPVQLSDNMVLEQNTSMRLCGETAPESAVCGKALFHSTSANMSGYFELTVTTHPATSVPQTLPFSIGMCQLMSPNFLFVGLVEMTEPLFMKLRILQDERYILASF
jgi:hypothetical protein